MTDNEVSARSALVDAYGETIAELVADKLALYKALEWAIRFAKVSPGHGYRCAHCAGKIDYFGKGGIIHKPDCPWIVAHALLTRLAQAKEFTNV
jgi:hypothetical protein